MPFYNQHSTVIAGVSSLPTGYTLNNSLRFRNSSTGYLYRDVTTTGNRKTFTYSCWLKITKVDTTQIFSCGTSGSSVLQARIVTNNGLQIYQESGGTTNLNRYTGSNTYLRDFSAWYHIVFVVDTTQSTADDRVKVYLNGVQLTSFSSSTNPSLNYDTLANYNDMWVGSYLGNVTSDTYQTEVHFLDGTAATADDFGQFDATTGVWKPKQYVGGNYGTNGFYLPMTATTQADGFNTVLYTGTGSTQTIGDVGFNPDLVWIKIRSSTARHVLVDSVRGSLVELYSNLTNADSLEASCPNIRDDGFEMQNGRWNNNGETYVGWCWDAGDNQTSTGVNSILYYGSGLPRKLTGFGFSPDLVIAKARSAGSPLLYDSVRGAGYFLQPNSTGAEGNDLTRLASYDADGFSYGSFTTGTNASNTEYIAWGWDAGDGDPASNTEGDITSTVKASDATGFSIVTYTGNGTDAATVGHGLTTQPSLSIIKNRDASTNWDVTFSGISGGTSLNLDTTSAVFSPTLGYHQIGASTLTLKNGGSGISRVNTSGEQYIAYCFSEVSGVSSIGTYTGTGSAGKAVTGLGFRPGFLMIKRTDDTAEWIIVDSSRSPFNPANDILGIDALGESSYGTTNRNIDFDSDGFTIQSTAAGGTTALNANGGTYLYMAFKGSYSDYVSPLNTDGDIDSRVKANTEKGFSIVSWEGNGSNSTIGHGLSSAPEFFFLKNRDTSVNDWIVYQSDVGATKFLRLNQTNATTTQTNIFNDTEPTSSVFTVGTNSAVNSSGVNYIAYCFHSVAGYSDIGTYSGTGVAGNSVTGLGFQPAFLMIKCTSLAGTAWVMYDNTREPDNDNNDLVLQAQSDAAELDGGGTTRAVTFDSDGFTLDTTYGGNNGSGHTYIYMAFADTRDAQFNFDASGNKNNFTANNINSNASSEPSYDIMTDVPTLTDENTANYATLNRLMLRGVGVDVSEGNLYANRNSSGWGNIAATIGVSSGKFYWEFLNDSTAATMVGVDSELDPTDYVGHTSTGYGYYALTGNKYNNRSSSSYGNTYTTGDIVGFALDMDNGKIWFAKNGVWQNSGDPEAGSNEAFSGLTGTYFPQFSFNNSGGDGYINFGQRPFKYTPPDGFLPINTYNLPDSDIVDGSEQFNTVLYTGNGSTQSITGVGFQPDLLWLKRRDSAENHGLHDVIRGSTNFHVSNQNADQYTAANSVTSFDSDGFSLGNYSNTNTSGSSMVAWNWKANGSGVSNTVGSINSTVSANTTAGFSIVQYTGNGSTSSGQTVGHGLGRTPEMIITKLQSGTQYNWSTWHKDLGGNYGIWLNLTNGRNSSMWGGYASHSSTVFVPADLSYNNVSGATYINYLWASIEGFSAFGSYTGNGSTDGPFIYTGFRPAWLLVKHTTSTESWYIFDAERSTYNAVNDYLLPNATNAEATDVTARDHDFLSNGFKIRNNNGAMNTNGSRYIYAAFAENPFKNALAR